MSTVIRDIFRSFWSSHLQGNIMECYPTEKAYAVKVLVVQVDMARIRFCLRDFIQLVKELVV